MEQIPSKSTDLDNKFVSFGERLRLERTRVGMQQLEMAEACEVSRKTISVWERGEQTPNAAVLALMASHGVDVLYVVTGQRAGEAESTLAPAERELLQAWRHGSEQAKEAIQAVAKLAFFSSKQ
ncbi:helix-turn-helix domain-containing protein [Comamonas terrigena]|uniref:helix-turn-helix domain-containing protein n=1 Tax=Comamonas terrigena TaxID=32013 RepID=UPI0028AE7471|nr:helix-turn-helix transcriptional regulator [Comamonas terrigena]